MARKCWHCGATFDDDGDACPRCGADLSKFRRRLPALRTRLQLSPFEGFLLTFGMAVSAVMCVVAFFRGVCLCFVSTGWTRTLALIGTPVTVLFLMALVVVFRKVLELSHQARESNTAGDGGAERG